MNLLLATRHVSDLPETPAQVPFEHLAAFGRWQKAVRVREKRRLATGERSFTVPGAAR